MPVRQHFPESFHQTGNQHRNLLRLPSVLYRQAEADRYRRPGGKVQEEIRHVKSLRGFSDLRGDFVDGEIPLIVYYAASLTVRRGASATTSVPGCTQHAV